MFWIGLICFVVGFVAGGIVGMFIVALCVAANNGDRIFIDKY